MAMIDVNRDAHLRLVSCYVDGSDRQEVRRTQHGVTSILSFTNPHAFRVRRGTCLEVTLPEEGA